MSAVSNASRELQVVVPAPGATSLASIRGGSAIVVNESGGGVDLVEVYFEGNVYRSEVLEKFAHRADAAASRLLVRYPTVARRLVPRGDVVVVGTFRSAEGVVHVAPECRGLLAQWLNMDPASSAFAEELVTSAYGKVLGERRPPQ